MSPAELVRFRRELAKVLPDVISQAASAARREGDMTEPTEQPEPLDGGRAAEAMKRYGLTKDDGSAFVQAFNADVDSKDPRSDRYERAARRTRTLKDQALMAEQDKKLGVKGYQALTNLADRAFHVAQPLPDEPEPVSLITENDGIDLRNLGEVAFKGRRQDADDQVDQEAHKRMILAGVDINTDDPEYNQLDYSDPDSYLASIDRAIAAKRRRISAGSIGDLNQLWKSAREQL